MHPLPNRNISKSIDAAHSRTVYPQSFRNYLLAALLVTLMFGPIAFGAVEGWSELILRISSVTLAAASIHKRDKQRPRSRILFPLLGIVAIGAFQFSAHITASRAASMHELLNLIAYIALCYVAMTTIRFERELRLFSAAIACFGTFYALIGISTKLIDSEQLYWFRQITADAGHMAGYVNHNHFSGLMEMLAPLPLGFAFQSRLEWGKRLLAGFGTVLIITSIGLAQSRAGIFSAVIGFAAFACSISIQGRLRQSWRIFAAVILATIAVGIYIGADFALLRFSEISMGRELLGGRLAIDRDALRMMPIHPLLGFGLGAFPVVYPRYRSFTTNYFINQAHNDILQLGVETGAIGLALFCWFVYEAFAGAYRANQCASGDTRIVKNAMGCGVLAMITHSFFDFNLHIPANAALFFVLATVFSLRVNSAQSREGSWL